MFLPRGERGPRLSAFSESCSLWRVPPLSTSFFGRKRRLKKPHRAGWDEVGDLMDGRTLKLIAIMIGHKSLSSARAPDPGQDRRGVAAVADEPLENCFVPDKTADPSSNFRRSGASSQCSKRAHVRHHSIHKPRRLCSAACDTCVEAPAAAKVPRLSRTSVTSEE